MNLTTLNDEIIANRHIENRMEVIMYCALPDAEQIKNKTEQLQNILSTTKLTIAQIYNEEFGGITGRTDSTFIAMVNKLILKKLGALSEEEEKKVHLWQNILLKKMFFLGKHLFEKDVLPNRTSF